MRFTKGKISRAIGPARAVPKAKLGAIASLLDIVDGASHWYSWEMKRLVDLIASMFNAQVETHHSTDNRASSLLTYTIEVHSEPVVTISEDNNATWHVTLRGDE